MAGSSALPGCGQKAPVSGCSSGKNKLPSASFLDKELNCCIGDNSHSTTPFGDREEPFQLPSTSSI